MSISTIVSCNFRAKDSALGPRPIRSIVSSIVKLNYLKKGERENLFRCTSPCKMNVYHPNVSKQLQKKYNNLVPKREEVGEGKRKREEIKKERE